MAVRKIVTIPNLILDKPCQKVTEVNSEVKEIIQDLKDTLLNSVQPGAGLAANQIGINKQICIVRDFFPGEKPGEETYKEYVLINPQMKVASQKQAIDWEGCLSVPDIFGMVQRFKKIKVDALNEQGKRISFTAEGFFARTIQHEIDHLNGIIFTSKIIGSTKTEKELDHLYDTKKLG